MVTQEDIAAQSGSLVGANKLIYKLGDEFYSEVDAWKAILNAKIGGVELPTSNSEHSPKKKDQGSAQNSLGGKASNDKLINAFRPSNSLLKRMNLRMGENDLTYEYFISAKATDKINVKIFLYPHDSRIVISDIDGTITK